MVIFLGGVAKRIRSNDVVDVDISIRKPGAINRARFMASCLYLLKICLYRKQFKSLQKNLKEAQILGEYIALLHAPYFLKAPLAACAPRNDRDFWVNLTEYKKCFDANSIQQKMLTAVQESVKNHLWYLTQELVVFGLFDEDLPPNKRQTMATTLLTYPRPNNFPPGKPYFPVELMVANPSLDLFIGERSWQMVSGYTKMLLNGI